MKINFYKSNVLALAIYTANGIFSIFQGNSRNYAILVIGLAIEFYLFYNFLS